MCRARCLAPSTSCLLLPGLGPGLGFLPHRAQEQVGTEACQAQHDRNWKQTSSTNAVVFLLHSLTFCSSPSWQLARLHPAEFCHPQTCPTPLHCHILKGQTMHCQDWPDQEQHPAMTAPSTPFLMPPGQSKTRDAHQNVSFLEHV